MESRLLPPSSSTWPNLLHGVNDLPWLHRAWVDDFIYVAQVAVRKGSGDVDEGFKLWHLAGHQQELLGGNDIQLHSFSGEDKAEEAVETLSILSCCTWCTALGVYVLQ